MRTVSLVWSLVTLLCAAWPVAAQSPIPIQVQNGTVTRAANATRPSVMIWGGGIDVNSTFDDGMFQAESCRPCEAGSTLSLRSRITATGKGHRLYDGDFSFDAPDIPVPADGSTDLILTAPFTMAGRVSFPERRNAGPESSGPTFDLEGAGTVTVRLSSTVDEETGRRLYFFRDVTYEFNPSR